MTIRYIDTRQGADAPYEFSEAIIKGIAPGGGLFVPERIPQLSLDEILGLSSCPYNQAAAYVYKRFETDFAPEKVDELMQLSYAQNFDTSDIAPVSHVGNLHVLELWHGPTSAFKDMALQCLPQFFSAAIEKRRAAGIAGSEHDFLIAVATSGDTGKAALAGFANRKHISIEVFYPDGGVSDIQFKQMATQLGDNVYVSGVRGNFDDCQTSVKKMFNDAAFNEKLAKECNTVLSSANSINWGRLMPQIVYYINAYSHMVATGALKAGEPIDVTVPTGNFGNILAAWYAQQMGTPVEHIVCASNTNRVLTDFIETGTYTIANRDFVLTPSPSMDILVSSNLERQLFEFAGRDASRVTRWMADLSSKGEFVVDNEVRTKLQSTFKCGSVNNDECLQTIRDAYKQHGYLIDPHTSVAWRVAQQHKGGNPMLVASTAHWAKFGDNVYRALNGIEAGSPLPKEVAALTGAQLNREIARIANVDGAPQALDMLDDADIIFNDVIDGAKEDIEAATLRFMG